MQVKATAKFIRISPRKVRLVVGLIRNLKATLAQEQLKAMPKAASVDVLKVLNSAVANAAHNEKVKKEDLVVAQAYVDEGPTLKRWRARAFGRAAQIRKRTSHITIVLSDKAKPTADLADSADKKKKKIAESKSKNNRGKSSKYEAQKLNDKKKEKKDEGKF